MAHKVALPSAPTLETARIAFLMSFLWPQRLGMLEALQRGVRDLRVFVSTTMERNRAWQPTCVNLKVIIQFPQPPSRRAQAVGLCRQLG
jgi:hypothetical protein